MADASHQLDRLLSPRCILFDAVGTLIAADPPVAEVYQQVGARHGARLPREKVDARFRAAFARTRTYDGIASSEVEHQRWQQVVGEVFRETPEACAKILPELWRHFSQPTAWRLYDDAPPLLAKLRRDGWRLGIASNFDERLVSVCRGHEELAELPLFWSTDVGHSKPHPQFFAMVGERLNLAPQEILLVGDDVDADVLGGRAAGWHVVQIDRDAAAPQFPAIKTLAALSQLLASGPPRA